MNDPNSLGEERGTPRPARAGGGTGGGMSAARGAALIAVAVILGIVLLNAIDDGNDGPVGDGGATSTTTSTTTTTTVKGSSSSSSTTPTTAAAISPAQVTVLVLNGSGRDGVASTLTNTLKAKGYKTLPPNNAPVRKGTVIDAKSGKTVPCTTLATLVPGAKVQAMPTPPPSTTDADCIVVIGS